MTLGKTLTMVGVVLVLVPPLSLLHPWGNIRAISQTNRGILTGANVPPEVREVIETKCIDCHTKRTHWAVYSRIAPASWLVEHDLFEARKPDRSTTKVGSEARSEEMPVRHYLVLHPKARLTTQEQQLLYDWARAERKRVRSEAVQQEP
jgi:uncharacterized membrane protein